MVFYPFKLKSSKKIFLLVCALVLIIAFQNAGVPEPKLIVHMAVNGSDTNSGLSANAPVKTLKRVLQIVKVARANSDVPVTISFGSGVYFGQQLIWDSFSSIYPTVFEPASGELGDVIFDGRSDAEQTWGSKSYFLSFKHPRGVTAGQRTNVVINKLHIRYYYEILTFSGADRNNPATAISHNSVSNSKFEKIGSRWAVLSTSTASSYAMAGIRLVNSTHNKFTGNIFENIDNAEYEEIGGAYFPKQNSLYYGGGLHAFYIAHHSSDNLFEGNTFTTHNSGSVLKIRDRSNRNNILRNKFDRVLLPIQIWHCDPHESMRSGRRRGLRSHQDLPSTPEHEPSNLVGCTKHPYTTPPQDYECLSYDVTANENIFGRNKDGVTFSTSNSPYNIFENATYACNPTRTNIGFIKEEQVVNTGVIQSTSLSGIQYFGRCQSASDCVNSSNRCYSNGTGSSHLLCDENVWHRCNRTQNNDLLYPFQANITTKTKVCQPDSDGSDAAWTDIPRGMFYIVSQNRSSTHRSFCATENSCVNHQGRCFTHLSGSPHALCDSKNWISCNLEVVNAASGNTAALIRGAGQIGSKICKKTADERDAIWTTLERDKFYIASFMASRWNYAVCDTATSCVNAEGRCYSDNTGSRHQWCAKNVWQRCGFNRIGYKSDPTNPQAKTCTRVVANGITDFVWK